MTIILNLFTLHTKNVSLDIGQDDPPSDTKLHAKKKPRHSISDKTID